MNDIFEHIINKSKKLYEMKDAPIVSITKIIDDDSGIYAGDEFDFALEMDQYPNYAKNPESRKRLADELRSVADMIEKDTSYEGKE